MAIFSGRKRETAARADRVSLNDEGSEERAHVAGLKSRVAAGLGMIAVFLVVLELMFPSAVPVSGTGLSVGQVAREEIVAPFDFDVLKSEAELTQEREQAAAGVVPVYQFDQEIHAEQRRRLGEFLTRVYGVRTGSESVDQKEDMLGQLGVALSETTRQVLVDPVRSDAVEERAREILNALYERGILRSRGQAAGSPDQTVMVVRGDDESMVRLRDFLPLSEARDLVRRESERLLGDRKLAKALEEIVVPFLQGNVVFDANETGRRRQEARDAVSELADRDFKKDEIILERGERITQEHVNIMRSMNQKRADLLLEESGPSRFFPPVGRILEALLLLGSLILYLSVRRGSMLLSRRCQLLFMVLIVLVVGTSAALRGIADISQYLVPIAVLAMLAAMLFDFEVAIIFTVVTVLLTGIYAGYGLRFVLISTVAGVVAAHSVRRVRHREDFYLAGTRVVVAYAVAIAVADLWRAEFGLETLTRCGWGGLNAILSMGIVVVALPLFERGFRVTTDITLLELADMNKPLLRKMAMSSPGTYHHSIVVGNLSEAAAKAIGANGLLARVAAYYHDIGKLVAPGYFVENQQGLEPPDSKHTRLKPKVSSLVIRAHVKDGVELAEKEGLPEPLIDVIREHHGTSVMEYFYNKAKEEAEDDGDIGPGEFSYPGPRPRSKESAIIALADTIEARVRSIGDKISPKRIEAEIDEVIEKRWQDRQLDDAELTLSDLRKIRDAFFRVLTGMYHQRIKYPDQDGDGKRKPPEDEAPGGRASRDEEPESGGSERGEPEGKAPRGEEPEGGPTDKGEPKSEASRGKEPGGRGSGGSRENADGS